MKKLVLLLSVFIFINLSFCNSVVHSGQIIDSHTPKVESFEKVATIDTISLDYALDELDELVIDTVTNYPPADSPPTDWIAYGVIVLVAAFQFFKNVIFKKRIIVLEKEVKKKKDV